MSEVLRAGVIGAGVFGAHHARQYSRLPGVVLSGVFDAHPDRAAALAVPLGARAFHALDAFLDAVDVVTVASPATVHAAQALAAIAVGKPVYVEKPLAAVLSDAQHVAEAARRAGLVLACGHQERVVFQAMGLFAAPERPLRLEAVRHGPASERSQDVSAVLDLMIHDIDLALSLTTATPVSVSGGSGHDAARVQVLFDDGFEAVFDVSRQAPSRRRTMRVVFPSGEVEVDFLSRTFLNTTPFRLNPSFAETAEGRDPLGASVQAFLDAVRGIIPRPVVDADEAVRALDLALRIQSS